MIIGARRRSRHHHWCQASEHWCQASGQKKAYDHWCQASEHWCQASGQKKAYNDVRYEVGISNLPSTVNYYDSDDRLIAQQWGGTNSSGISAGGTVAYARQEVNIGVDPNNPDLPREIVTVSDRNGNETVYYYNNGKNLTKKEQQTRGIRPGDPAVYVTEYKYTATGLLKETITPQGDRTVYEYDMRVKLARKSLFRKTLMRASGL